MVYKDKLNELKEKLDGKDSGGEKEMGYEVATTSIVKGQHPSPTNSKQPEPKCADGSPLFPDIKDKFYSKKLGLEPSENDTIVGVETICPKCGYILQYHFRKGKELISEFVDDLTNQETIKRYPYPTNKALLIDREDFVRVIRKWEEKLK